MADPVSITGLVIEIGGLLKYLCDYGRAVSHAQKDIISLYGELSALKGILADIESGSNAVSGPKVHERLQHTHDLVSELSGKLITKSKPHQRALQSLQWPLSESQVKRTLAEIERLKAWFLLRMMTNTQSDLREIHSGIDRLTTLVQDDVSERKNSSKAQEIEAIRKLLAPISPHATHRKACETWHDTPSGSWLLEGEFRSWLLNTDPRDRVFTLTGRSGSGKTMLFSQAVEQARSILRKEHDTRLAYFYCSYSSAASQELRNILGSLLVQISDDVALTDRYHEYLTDAAEVTREHIENSISAVGGTVLLFLDAVNESTEADAIRDCSLRLTSRSSDTTIRCFITTTTISHPLSASPEINMQAHRITPDIESYIRRKIARSPILQSFPEATIVGALTRKADGMFRWVDCQITILSSQRTPKLLMKALQDLPGSLNDTYSRILSSIPVVDRSLAREALLWLCYANRPLELDELCEAVVYECGDRAIEHTYRLEPPHQLVQICDGLVIWDEVTNTVSLAHSSVRDFLTGKDIAHSSAKVLALDETESHRHIVRKSLSYLSMDAFRDWYTIQRRATWWFEQYPLLIYISENWCLHARTCQHDLGESNLQQVDSFIHTNRTSHSRSLFNFWIQCLLLSDEDYDDDDRDLFEAAEPLYYMASFGFDVYVDRMFAQNYISKSDPAGLWYIDHKCGRALSTALQVACWRGSLHTVRTLLNEGADPNSTNVAGLSCLMAANIHKRTDVVQDLLQYGAKLNETEILKEGQSWHNLETDVEAKGRIVLLSGVEVLMEED